MSGPKKPRAAAPKPAPAAPLTADQLRVAQHFAAMDDRAQEGMLRMMAAMADSFPRHKRPTLRLVGGGAK
ncbi:hypothetical protein NHH73_25095 [Oxalobacteraceae bacterium OTU3CINTB1]|nr:hypothetical protein NHH73_25095 [Oxalobacteraceae bacterium OTU3CINTB1]